MENTIHIQVDKDWRKTWHNIRRWLKSYVGKSNFVTAPDEDEYYTSGLGWHMRYRLSRPGLQSVIEVWILEDDLATAFNLAWL